MFGTETMRLLREKWKSPWALAQELYAILQDDVPITHSGPVTLSQAAGSTQAPLTIRTFGGDVPALRFVNRDGFEVGGFTFDNGVMRLDGQAQRAQKCRCPESGGLLTPVLIWPGSANEVLGGRLLDADILNAVAYDPRTVDGPHPVAVPGVYVYTPPAGTLLTGNTSPTLHVAFTPTNTAVFASVEADLNPPMQVVTIQEQALGASPPVVVGQIILVYVIVVNGDNDADPAPTTAAVTDSLGHSYAQAGSYQTVSAIKTTGPSPRPAARTTISIWYAIVTTAGTATITVTPTPAASVTFRATVVSRADVAGSPLDGVASNTAVIDHTPITVETTTIGSSAGDGELDLFVGLTGSVDAQFIAGGGFGDLTTRTNHDPQNLTAVNNSEVTTPNSRYVALGVSFRQKPSP